jgi:D-alanyl-D-alanine carboxypeptidase
MNDHESVRNTLRLSIYIGAGAGLLLAGSIGYALFLVQSLTGEVRLLSAELAKTNESTGALSQNLDELHEKATGLEQKAVGLEGTLSVAQQALQSTKSELETTKSQVEGTAKTVGTLEKLSKIDPEVLQKYSKVYFLNENYNPQAVTALEPQYLYHDNRPESIESRVYPHLISLLNAAKNSGIELYVKSAYRSFDEQGALKNNYSVTYGTGANAFSADQGYSEHQLGTTVDFITTGLGGQLQGFHGTNAYTWLQNNAHLYGFILSYPQGNAFYIFEPWHWRYVGVPLASYLYTNKKSFYDLDQREIDTYLVTIYD